MERTHAHKTTGAGNVAVAAMTPHDLHPRAVIAATRA